MDAILLKEVTPQQLTETILKGVETQINDLKKSFTLKEPDDFLTRMEVAKLLKISLTTVHEWANTGVLKMYKVGNRTYFSRKEIEKTLFSSNV
ncbi:helix-turn-helix domain-containing protein [Polaribacter sp. BAL334]|uniref:helix-turn-helix domain-containing protein n=1 Tax=Polaribacter sp. BAL334 TaxID=1708178 RepID=UPI0018D2219B|nr:helix-turn-helix domain-containing protein [Polaribacter sp. BAL334]MBG7612101.1 helix-turn-helix domain-containing protein [Polaribacter sp. BAL334]